MSYKEHHLVVDITELATLGDQFPLRLQQLGFRLMQMVDETGRDLYRYVLPPVCAVPAGPFLMGSDQHQDVRVEFAELDDYPQYEETLDTFAIGQYPVTVAEWASAVQVGAVAEPRRFTGCTWQDQQAHPDHPVVCISWYEAMAYAAWLAQVTGELWRLPTEAEWEKAARGTDGRIYPWGNQWDNTKANTRDGGPGHTTPVGAYAEKGDASPYGAHDMAGNVCEWTSTIIPHGDDPPYDAAPHEKHVGTGSYCVLRGGSFVSITGDVRTARRGMEDPDFIYDYFGVRLVRGAAAGT